MQLSDFVTEPVYEREPYKKEHVSKAIAVRQNEILLEETIFYPNGGGQPGDSGRIGLSNGDELKVLDTYRDGGTPSQIWLKLDNSVDASLLGKQMNLMIDWHRRYRHMQMHSCLHLLCSLVDAPVTGCSMSVDKGRLDFDLPEPGITKEQVTQQLNERIAESRDVTTSYLTADEYYTGQGLSRTSIQPPVFGGKVRVVKIESTDEQSCGGTHVSNTAEIAPVYCHKIEKKSKHNRRFILRWT